MERFVQAFRRNADGSWTCMQAATLDAPGGRIQVTPGSTFYPGTQFMNLDIARWLERASTRSRKELE